MRKKQSGFGIIIAKTRGACVIATIWPNKEMGRNQDGLGGWIGLARGFGLNCPCICKVMIDYVKFILKIESLRTINMYLGLLRKEDDHVHNKHNLGASPPLVSRVSSR
jgi:hypothetical protein